MKPEVLLALYGGPDQLMPLTSGLTAVFAFLVIFWNKALIFWDKIAGFLCSGKPSTDGAKPPVNPSHAAGSHADVGE